MVPTDTDVRQILEGCMVARLATMSSSGRPHVNPIYFVLHDGKIHLGTTTGTLAARNVFANPKVQILLDVESERDDPRILRITGDAVVLTDSEVLADYKRSDERKYFRSLPGLWMSLTHIRQLFLTRQYLASDGAGSTHCVIEVRPTKAKMLTKPTLQSGPHPKDHASFRSMMIKSPGPNALPNTGDVPGAS